MVRLAIICTHPIQYYAPVFTALAQFEELDIRVFYGWRGATQQTLDHGFGQRIAWDVPLLDGYVYEFVENVAKDPGSHHYQGIDCPSLCKKIAAWKADAVLVYGWCYKSHLRAMRYFKGRVPVFFRGDSTLLDETPGWRTRLRRVFLKWVYSHVDIAFSVGTNNGNYFKAHGLRGEQIVHAPHAVDNDRFRAKSLESCGEIREELEISKDCCVIAFCGKLEAKKSPDLLMQSFSELADANAALVFAGSGPLEDSLRGMACKNVHFIGFQNQTQVPRVYQAADLVVLPSRGPGETWGLALNEAMACSRAVLASDRVGAAVDLIQPGENGWIVQAGDGESLRGALAAAVRLGRDGLQLMGERSRIVINEWSIAKQSEAMVKTLLEVAFASAPKG